MKNNRFMAVALTFCCLALIGIPAARAMDGQIKIGRPADGESYPIVINHAGSYVLTDNLVVGDPDVDAIRIEVNDVTLDLNGHTIYGPTSAGLGKGIYVYNQYGVTIRNGRVWGFGAGIFLESTGGDPSEKSAGHMIKDILASNSVMNGISIFGGTVTDCVSNSNGNNGIAAGYSSLHNCTTNNNVNIGLYIQHSTAFNCTANANHDNGISAYYSTIANMTANKNGNIGISVFRSSVTNSTAYENTNAGMWIHQSRAENNFVSENHSCGLIINQAGSFVIKNTGNNNLPNNIATPPAGNYVPLIGDNANVFF
jgi:hypothetical protein